MSSAARAILYMCFLLICTSLSNCVQKPGTWKNNEIDASLRNDFKQMNTQLLQAVKTNDPGSLENILSKQLLDEGGMNRLIELANIHAQNIDYKLYDEYYVVHKYIDTHAIQSPNHGINTYRLEYFPDTEEMYIAIFMPRGGNNKWMLTAIYNKYNYGWKLSNIQTNPYTINGKTAPELYCMAMQQHQKNYLIDAVNTLALASSCLRPNNCWHYNNDDKIAATFGLYTQEANQQYTFPCLIKNVPGQPRVFRIANRETTDGQYPVINYITTVKVSDTAAMLRENQMIKKVIEQTFPGINHDKKYVLYDAYNEVPNGKNTVEHFEIKDKL